MTSDSELVGICRAHGRWFQIDKVHEPCPEPGCEAACDYYRLIPDAELLRMTNEMTAAEREQILMSRAEYDEFRAAPRDFGRPPWDPEVLDREATGRARCEFCGRFTRDDGKGHEDCIREYDRRTVGL